MKKTILAIVLSLVTCSYVYGNSALEMTEKLRYTKGNTANARMLASTLERNLTELDIKVSILDGGKKNYLLFFYSDPVSSLPCEKRVELVKNLYKNSISIGGEAVILANDSGVFSIGYVDGKLVSIECSE